MLLEKYFFYYPVGNKVISKKSGLSRPLSYYDQVCLYLLKRNKIMTRSSLIIAINEFELPISRSSLSRALDYLLNANFILSSENGFQITPLGYEHLARVRRYLLNKRLR
jgi:hypothetical protein